MIIIRHKYFSLRGTRALAGFNKNIRRMRTMKAKRTAIKTQNKVIDKAAKIKTSVEKIADNPGKELVRDNIKKIIETPITGSATVALPGGSIIQATKLPTLEGKILKKTGIDKCTKKVAKSVDKSIGGYVENGVNNTINYLKFV